MLKWLRCRMDANEQAAAAQLEQISRYHMPFGMFGPKHYPPKGVPIYDLPAEYLAWFALEGLSGRSTRRAAAGCL